MTSPRLQLCVREATDQDSHGIARLIHYEIHVHRHLDWRPPLEWIGYQPYLVVESERQLLAALACPPDPPGVAWIRLFACASQLAARTAWTELWPRAREALAGNAAPVQAAVIPLQAWFYSLLEHSEFVFTHKVVVLSWSGSDLPAANPAAGVRIRPMRTQDLPAVEGVDHAAFTPIWRNSLASLEIAFRQAVDATVAEVGGEILGYQLTSATTAGWHLGRLAVVPPRQGQGIGYALLRDLLLRARTRGFGQLTVNTQHNNQASLALYQKAGFRLTGEVYPVFECPIL